ncbi:MAG: sigma-54 dependent transcriptional regulator, partial [Proteobacteria bacterium]|nr:sigma-54 dependent transcriptional regulator [Pseudomonadota bacterium]
PFDKNVHFLHNFRSQSTFNPNNNLLNGLLSSLLATFKFSCGCVFHASNPSLDLDVCVYINLAYFNKHPKDIWGQVALKALEKKQSIFINTSNKIKHEITEKHSDNTFDDSNYISIVFYVDALDCGEYIFCISGVAQGSLKNIINDQSIKLFENYISTQICIDKAQHYAQQDHVNSSQNYSHYSKNDIDIIFQSRSMKEVIDRVDNLARKDTTVLILGESGVGKELIAKRLHEESRRKGQFVSVNLANIPYELFESECYGHEKGSFTGAVQKKIGLFELADEGTLFIDEIGDIPLALQVKLLRVLQERQFARVGGTKLLKSNFRLITATNRDLVEEIRQGRFREDLFYRLNVVSIHIPPLRDRQEDIIFLADHFLRYYCSRYQLPTKHIDNDMRQRLYEYPWPGNVRELKNYIERYCVLSDKHFIPLPVQNQLEPQDSQPAPYNNSVSQLVDEKPTLRDLNDAYFEFIYKTKNGAVGGAKGIASILGISRTTAYSWIERLKLKEKYELVLKNSESE